MPDYAIIAEYNSGNLQAVPQKKGSNYILI